MPDTRGRRGGGPDGRATRIVGTGARKSLGVAIAVALGIAGSACGSPFTPLTEAAYEKYQGEPAEAVRLELLSASPQQIRLAVVAEYEGVPDRRSIIEFDPKMQGCTSVRVAILSGGSENELALARPTPAPLEAPPAREVIDGTQRLMRAGSYAATCRVGLRVSGFSRELAVQAENETRVLGQAVVESPRSLLWLAVLPAAAAADVLVVAPTVILYELATDNPFVEIYAE